METKLKKFPTKIWSLDSFKIRIPYKFVEVINPLLESHYIKVSTDTGEQLDEQEFKDSALSFVEIAPKSQKPTGVKCKYLVQYVNTEKYVCILINSKWLHSDYSEGINSYTVKKVYDRVIAHGVIKCSLDVFLSGELTDVDVKCDDYLPVHSYVDLVKYSKWCTKESTNYLSGSRIIGSSGQDNYGIMFSERSKAGIENPFIKIYNKQGELLHKDSAAFSTFYLSEYETQNLRRIEFCLKNKKMFERFTRSKNTRLREVLNFSQQKWNRIATEMLHKHLKMYTKTRSVGHVLSGKNRALYGLIVLLVNNSPLSEQAILNDVLEQQWPVDSSMTKEQKQAVANDKYKQAKLLNEIMEFAKNNDKEVANKLKNNTFSTNYYSMFLLKSDIKKEDYGKYNFTY